jgi:hypothetical protein
LIGPSGLLLVGSNFFLSQVHVQERNLQSINAKGKQLQIASTFKIITIIYQFYYNYSYNSYVIVHGEGNDFFKMFVFKD